MRNACCVSMGFRHSDYTPMTIAMVSMYYLNANQEVSTGFRSQSSRARSARVLSGLNPVDTDWSAFNYYRSETMV